MPLPDRMYFSNLNQRALQPSQILAISSNPAVVEMMHQLDKPTVLMAVEAMEAQERCVSTQVTLAGFDLSAVKLIARAQEQELPFAMALVDVQDGMEEKASRIVAALYHADLDLQIVLLLSPGTRAAEVGSQIPEGSHRLAVLRLPCDLMELRQWTKVLAAKWVQQKTRPKVTAAEEVDLTPCVALVPAKGRHENTRTTILVVDDDESMCRIMSQVLATQKHRVLTARSANEGWQSWCENRDTIKLLVTDINMPGGPNGVALGEAIHEADCSVPVIYTSGHRAAYQYAELHIGSNYLPKPFGMHDLLKVVERNLAAG